MGAATMKGIIKRRHNHETSQYCSTSVKTNLEGTAGVLKIEIELDKNRGLDTTKKEELLVKTSENLEGLYEDLGEKIADASNQLENANEVDGKDKTSDKEKEDKNSESN